jgi:hypothetical protein
MAAAVAVGLARQRSEGDQMGLEVGKRVSHTRNPVSAISLAKNKKGLRVLSHSLGKKGSEKVPPSAT